MLSVPSASQQAEGQGAIVLKRGKTGHIAATPSRKTVKFYGVDNRDISANLPPFVSGYVSAAQVDLETRLTEVEADLGQTRDPTEREALMAHRDRLAAALNALGTEGHRTTRAAVGSVTVREEGGSRTITRTVRGGRPIALQQAALDRQSQADLVAARALIDQQLAGLPVELSPTGEIERFRFGTGAAPTAGQQQAVIEALQRLLGAKAALDSPD